MTRKRATSKPRRKRESKLLAEIRLALGLRNDILVCRINTGVFRPIDGPQNRFIRSAPNGFPDLVCCWFRKTQASREFNPSGLAYTPHIKNYLLEYGQYLVIETKAENGVLSEAQLDFKAATEAVGGIYIAPRTLNEVLDLLDSDPADGKHPLAFGA